MLTHIMLETVDASANDVLHFLERETQSISPCINPSRQANGREETFCFDTEYKSNIVSIYAKLSASDCKGDEIIRFEVAQHAKTRSIVKAFYNGDNPCFIRIFYSIWARLAIGFRAPFAGEALKKLRESE